MKRVLFVVSMCALLAAAGNSVLAQQRPDSRRASTAEAVLTKAAESGQFTFIVFFKDDSPPTTRMKQVVQDGVRAHAEQAVIAFAQVSDPANAALVEQLAVGRTPMPLTVVVAPNGAITGMFSKQVQDENIDAAIVTPTMTRCMKSLQENKLVFVCVRATAKSAAPPCIKQIQGDPDFKDRLAVVAMQIDDPNEERFFEQMKIDPASVKGAVAVLLAPPGVLIGKYDAAASVGEVTTALHKAGKCCDDPNCKHNRGATGPQAKKPVQVKRGAR